MTILKEAAGVYALNSLSHHARLQAQRMREASSDIWTMPSELKEGREAYVKSNSGLFVSQDLQAEKELTQVKQEAPCKRSELAKKITASCVAGLILLNTAGNVLAETVSGHVYSALDKQPVPSLIVKLNGNQTATDANGFYTISKDVGINDNFSKVKKLESKLLENPADGTANITLPNQNSVLKIYNTSGQEKNLTSILDPGMYLVNIDNSIGKLVVTSPSRINVKYTPNGFGLNSSNAKPSQTVAADNILTVDDEEIIGAIGNWFQYQDSLKLNPSSLDIWMIPNPDTSIFQTKYHRNLLGFVNRIIFATDDTIPEGGYGLRNYKQDTTEVYMDTTKSPHEYYNWAFAKFIEDINKNCDRKVKRIFIPPTGNNAIIFDQWSQDISQTMPGPPVSVCYVANDFNDNFSEITRELFHEGAHAYIPFFLHSGDDDFVTHAMGNTILDPYYRYTFDPSEYVAIAIINNLPHGISIVPSGQYAKLKKYKEE